jgi:hypothetical protein
MWTVFLVYSLVMGTAGKLCRDTRTLEFSHGYMSDVPYTATSQTGARTPAMVCYVLCTVPVTQATRKGKEFKRSGNPWSAREMALKYDADECVCAETALRLVLELC